MHDDSWKSMSKSILKSELAKKCIDYQLLSEKLTLIGVNESPSNINSKINRGTFSFIFFMQCMRSIHTDNVSFDNRVGNHE